MLSQSQKLNAKLFDFLMLMLSRRRLSSYEPRQTISRMDSVKGETARDYSKAASL